MPREAYDPVNALFESRLLPAVSMDEARRGAQAIARKFGRKSLGEPHQLYDYTVRRIRRCWRVSKPNRDTNRGWPRLVHDLSHDIWERRCPKLRPHHPHHARLELEIAQYVVAQGWLDGALRPKPKAKPAPDARRAAELARTEAAIKRWTTKKKRAETALRKLTRKQRRLAREVEARTRAAIAPEVLTPPTT